jgi:hypothetical protein
MEPRAFALNLDADLELAAGPRYAPTRRTLAAMAAMRPPLAASLLAPGDRLVDEASPPASARGLVGVAFCPTPRGLSLLAAAGAIAPRAPSFDVLRAVNHRRFCASLGQTLPGARWIDALEDARALLAEPSPLGGDWRIKRAFGMSGRGQRVVSPGALDDGARASIVAGIAEGGVQIEPQCAITRELGLHGWLSSDGHLSVGRLVEQRCDAMGAWVSTELARDVPDSTRSAIAAELSRVAAALHAAGYFGPFGVDAYLYRVSPDPDAPLALQPRSEINARLSMGFATGFGPVP